MTFDEYERELRRRRRLKGRLDGVGAALGYVLTVVLFVAGIFVLTWALNAPPCQARGAMMGVPADYGFFTGCMVQVDRRWIPIESYRVLGAVE